VSEPVGGGVLQWWWVRHAPSASTANIIHGTDTVAADLSDRDALSQLADRLPSNAIGLTSGIARASQTYEALRGFDPTLPIAGEETDFRDQDFGIWTGRTWDDVATIAPDFWRDPITVAPPGGESYAVMCRRVLRRIIAHSHEQREGRVIALAHAGTIRAALALALDLDFAATIRFEIEPLSITRIDAFVGPDDISWRVAGVNIGALNALD
jgi:alpha-ribazole phosphatase